MRKFLLTMCAGLLLSSPAWSAVEISQPEPGALRPKLELKMASSSSKFHAPRSLNNAKEIRKAKPDLYSGRVIDAAMIASNAWADFDMFSTPYGLYKMDMGTGQATPVLTDPFCYDFYSAAYSEEEFIGVRVMSMMGMFNGLNYVSINPQTMTENWNIQYGEASFSDLPCVMAYNPVDKEFYSLNYNESMTGLNLGRFDHENRLFYTYESWKSNFQPIAMAFSPRGVCYVIGGDGGLYTVDLDNCTTTRIGETGVTPSLYVQAMTFDGVTGNFIWAAETNRGARIYAVDPETAETEEIATLTDNQQFAAVHLPENSAYYGAPAQVQSIGFSAYGGVLDGNVTFSIPSTTFAGAAMTGDVRYNVWIDGKPIAENIKSTVGQYVSVPATLTEGNHVFAVLLSNSVGDSPVKSTDYWAGFDYPKAPAYVNLEATDGDFNVSWASVYEGQHQGYVDWQITYNVYRMPDNVKVGDGISGTTFSEPIPSKMQRYYYEVTAVNSDGKEGARMASQEILQGDAAEVPYFEGFDDDTYKALWRFEDRTGQDRTWRLQTGEMIADLYQGENDLWAIVPPIALESDYKYQMILNLRQAFGFTDDIVRVYIGKKGDDLDNFVRIADFDKEALPDDFDDITVDFLVEESGAYEFGIQVTAADNGGTVRFNSVAIEKLGKIGAPECATEIEVVPDADDALEATISFTAPSTTLEGKPLESISYFKVLVDGEENATISRLTPGAKVSQTITDINGVGKHLFTLVPFNDEGEGKAATVSQFIGCYTAPYSESFDTEAGMEFWTAEYNFDIADLFQVPLHYGSYDGSIEVSWFADDAGEETWVFSPDFKLDEESVYILTFDFNNQHYGEGSTYTLNIGKGAKAENQSLLQNLPMESYYKFSPVNTEVVIKDAAKYNFGFYSYSTGAFDYPSYKIDNLGLTYLTSAMAPYAVTDYKGVADVKGKLEADLSFKAPLVDFAGRTLSSIEKIEILRGTQVVSTIDNPTPGDELSWHDSNANYGKNTYSIVAYNSEGRGKVYEADLFVGEDVPAVENATLIGNADNMSATLSWDRTEFGVNGGILMDEDMRYQVFEFNPDTESVNLISTVTETSYTFPVVTEKPQTLYYYGVVPVNDVNSGSPVILSVQLGELYTLPYAESFANGLPQTGLWTIYSQNPYISWQPTNYFWDGIDAQDGDGGAAIFFNGNGYVNYAGDRLYSPKFSVEDTGSAVLKFYVLHSRQPGSEDYPYPALMRVGISTDDSEFEIVTNDEDMEFDGSNPDWQEFTIQLTPSAGCHHMRICFDGYTNGGYEGLYLDNITISGLSLGVEGSLDTASTPVAEGGIGEILIRNAEGCNIMIFELSGVQLGRYEGKDVKNIAVPQGIYLVKIDDAAFKVHVR